MQVWLVSGDPILVAEAQPFFATQAQQEAVSPVSTDVVATEQPEGCSMRGEQLCQVGLDDRNRSAGVGRPLCKKFGN